MNGLDYPAQLAADRARSREAERIRAAREGAAEALEPPFPYRCRPFRPADFGAIPSAQRERESETDT